jgi:hypothetical protein
MYEPHSTYIASLVVMPDKRCLQSVSIADAAGELY